MTTETIKLTDAEAAAAESQAGYLVRLIEPAKAMKYADALEIATDLAKSTGASVGVFKVCAVVEPETTKPQPLPSAAVVEQARRAMAGVK